MDYSAFASGESIAGLISWVPAMLAAGGGGGSTTGPVPDLWSIESAMALLTLTAMEIVLGIDNVVFISILVNKLPERHRNFARRLGLGLAMGIRILLLFGIYWVMQLTWPLFSIPAFWPGKTVEQLDISGRDLVLIVGGCFLLWKATHEIHHKLEDQQSEGGAVARSLGWTIVQILLLDIVFSLDSVITAVGMAQHIEVMVAAVVVSVCVMLIFSGTITTMINRHPTLQMLALSFLLLIGVMLLAEGFHFHVPKGYIYFAMAFSVGVELLNIFSRRKKSAGPGHGAVAK